MTIVMLRDHVLLAPASAWRCDFTSALVEQASEGQTAGEAAAAHFEGVRDAEPVFTGGLGDGAGPVGWPSAGPRVKCVDPGDDLRNRQIG